MFGKVRWLLHSCFTCLAGEINMRHSHWWAGRLFGAKSHTWWDKKKRGPFILLLLPAWASFSTPLDPPPHHSGVQVNTLDQSDLSKCCTGSRWVQDSASWFSWRSVSVISVAAQRGSEAPAKKPPDPDRVQATGDFHDNVWVWEVRGWGEGGHQGPPPPQLHYSPAKISQGLTSSRRHWDHRHQEGLQTNKPENGARDQNALPFGECLD